MAKGYVRYSREVAEQIAHYVSLNMSLAEIGRQPGMPDRVTLIRWLARHEELNDLLRAAREVQADVIDDEQAEVIEHIRRGKLNPRAGAVVLNAMQWRAARKAPRKYGDNREINLNADVRSRNLTDEQLAAAITAAAGEAGLVITDGRSGAAQAGESAGAPPAVPQAD